MWSPTNTGEPLNPPPRRCFQTSAPVSLFQHIAMPSSVTAYRCPSRHSIDGTYTRVLRSHAIPVPSALTAATWFRGYPPLVKTCFPSVTTDVTHSVVEPLISQFSFPVSGSRLVTRSVPVRNNWSFPPTLRTIGEA